MPEQPNDFELTEADIDMVLEETTGKLKKPVNLAAGIASMRQRITQLETEKTKMLDRMDAATEDAQATLNEHLAEMNRDIAAARERLAYYESQIGRQN